MRPPIYEQFVVGRAKPQGSLNPILHKQTGKIITRQDPKVIDWRSTIQAAMAAHRPEMQAKGVAVRVAFIVLIAMPEGMYRQLNAAWKRHKRGKGPLPADLIPCNHGTGDADKLMRAIGDALTSWAYEDDCQISFGTTKKRYVRGQPGVLIRIWLDELTDDERALYKGEGV